jgi:hypothetical protein
MKHYITIRICFQGNSLMDLVKIRPTDIVEKLSDELPHPVDI